MSEPPMYITEQQFESAMVELSARPELFDILFDENVTYQLTTGYLTFDCSNVSAHDSQSVFGLASA